jgi:hypothetical protein
MVKKKEANMEEGLEKRKGEKVRCERLEERSEMRPGRKRCNKKY